VSVHNSALHKNTPFSFARYILCPTNLFFLGSSFRAFDSGCPCSSN